MWPTFDNHLYCCELPRGSKWNEGWGQGGTLRTWCSEYPVSFSISRAEEWALGARFPVRANCCRPALLRTPPKILGSWSTCPNIPTILNPAVEGLTILRTSRYMQLPFLPQSRPTGVTCLKLRLLLCTTNAMKLTWLCTAATLKKL